MFVLLKQYFDADLPCFGQFVLINLACKSKGRFADTHVSINQIHIMQRVRVRNQSHSRLWGSVVVRVSHWEYS